MAASLPDVTGLSWARIRDQARSLSATPEAEQLAQAAAANLVRPALDTTSPSQRMLAVYLIGAAAAGRGDRLDLLRRHVPTDPSWEVQEALAQAFDAWCAAVGYEAALPTIDAWLADDQPNARRAVSEGLRPWTSRRRPYFAARPAEAVRRLAALRTDPSRYVRHSAGNALRDIGRAHGELVDAETATWDLDDPLVRFTHERVLRAR